MVHLGAFGEYSSWYSKDVGHDPFVPQNRATGGLDDIQCPARSSSKLPGANISKIRTCCLVSDEFSYVNPLKSQEMTLSVSGSADRVHFFIFPELDEDPGRQEDTRQTMCPANHAPDHPWDWHIYPSVGVVDLGLM